MSDGDHPISEEAGAIKRGTQVHVKWEGKHYPATYHTAHGDGTHTVEWHDGSGRDRVGKNDVSLDPSPPTVHETLRSLGYVHMPRQDGAAFNAYHHPTASFYDEGHRNRVSETLNRRHSYEHVNSGGINHWVSAHGPGMSLHRKGFMPSGHMMHVDKDVRYETAETADMMAAPLLGRNRLPMDNDSQRARMVRTFQNVNIDATAFELNNHGISAATDPALFARLSQLRNSLGTASPRSTIPTVEKPNPNAMPPLFSGHGGRNMIKTLAGVETAMGEFKTGQHVRAHWQGAEWPATYVKQHLDGSHSVQWHDGSGIDRLNPGEVRHAEGIKPPSTAKIPPAPHREHLVHRLSKHLTEHYGTLLVTHTDKPSDEFKYQGHKITPEGLNKLSSNLKRDGNWKQLKSGQEGEHRVERFSNNHGGEYHLYHHNAGSKQHNHVIAIGSKLKPDAVGAALINPAEKCTVREVANEMARRAGEMHRAPPTIMKRIKSSGATTYAVTHFGQPIGHVAESEPGQWHATHNGRDGGKHPNPKAAGRVLVRMHSAVSAADETVEARGRRYSDLRRLAERRGHFAEVRDSGVYVHNGSRGKVIKTKDELDRHTGHSASDECAASEHKPGDSVHAKWNGRYYPATVQTVHSDGTHTVQWHDGGLHDRVTEVRKPPVAKGLGRGIGELMKENRPASAAKPTGEATGVGERMVKSQSDLKREADTVASHYAGVNHVALVNHLTRRGTDSLGKDKAFTKSIYKPGLVGRNEVHEHLHAWAKRYVAAAGGHHISDEPKKS